MEQYTLEKVKNYYGEVLKSTQDLKTSACCTADSIPKHVRPLLADIHPDITNRFYGCGSPIPFQLEGCHVLDLGCGTGRDCFMLSKLVGPSGSVTGVDMTEAQLQLAREHEGYHAEKFGYRKPNTLFKQGYIEDLESSGISSQSMDAVISNCVLNLSPDKPRVFKEIFRVLKPGGELYFSDVFSAQRIPKELQKDPVLLGECLAGALYIEDFRRVLFKCGIRDYRVVEKSPIELVDPEISKKIGNISFYSMTIRAFNVQELEDRCEDYGQVAYYLGTIEHNPHFFKLDDHHIFTTGKPMLVCSNTAYMLERSRYAPNFRIEGNLETHYGLFDCSPIRPSTAQPIEGEPSGACC